MRLRSVVPTDAPLIARHRYPDERDQALRTPYTDWVVGALERGSYLGWFVEIAGEIRAGAGLILLDWGPTKRSSIPYRGRIVNVFTEPHSRGKGLATFLVERCLEEAGKWGINEVGLSSTAAARSLYSKLGFRRAESEMSLTINFYEDA